MVDMNRALNPTPEDLRQSVAEEVAAFGLHPQDADAAIQFVSRDRAEYDPRFAPLTQDPSLRVGITATLGAKHE